MSTQMDREQERLDVLERVQESLSTIPEHVRRMVSVKAHVRGDNLVVVRIRSIIGQRGTTGEGAV